MGYTKMTMKEYCIKLYKRVYSVLFGVKKEMPLFYRISFSVRNKMDKMGRHNVIESKRSKCKGNTFWIHGNRNRIVIGENSQISKVVFEISGDDNQILIGDYVTLRDSILHIGDNGSFLSIGNGTAIGGGLRMHVLESSKVQIGEECMFSTNISIMNSDSHSIIDLSNGRRINEAMDVYIGNHVWLGQNVTVLKGVVIERDVVIGSRSMLTKGLYKSNSVYAGSPARFLRGGVDWLHERMEVR